MQKERKMGNMQKKKGSLSKSSPTPAIPEEMEVKNLMCEEAVNAHQDFNFQGLLAVDAEYHLREMREAIMMAEIQNQRQ